MPDSFWYVACMHNLTIVLDLQMLKARCSSYVASGCDIVQPGRASPGAAAEALLQRQL